MTAVRARPGSGVAFRVAAGPNAEARRGRTERIAEPVWDSRCVAPAGETGWPLAMARLTCWMTDRTHATTPRRQGAFPMAHAVGKAVRFTGCCGDSFCWFWSPACCRLVVACCCLLYSLFVVLVVRRRDWACCSCARSLYGFTSQANRHARAPRSPPRVSALPSARLRVMLLPHPRTPHRNQARRERQ